MCAIQVPQSGPRGAEGRQVEPVEQARGATRSRSDASPIVRATAAPHPPVTFNRHPPYSKQYPPMNSQIFFGWRFGCVFCMYADEYRK